MEVTLLLFWLVVYLFACLSDLVSHFERGHGPIPEPPPPPCLLTVPLSTYPDLSLYIRISNFKSLTLRASVPYLSMSL